MPAPQPHRPRLPRTGLAIAALALGGLALAWAVSAPVPPWAAFESASSSSASVASRAAPPTSATAAVAAADPGIALRVRDSQTGRFLQADARIVPLDRIAAADAGTLLRIAPAGGRVLSAGAGSHAMHVSAAGHLPLATRLEVGLEPALPVTVWLPPEQPSLALDRQALAAAECGDCSLISGHVYDQARGVPLAGVAVQAGQVRAVSDAQGRFQLQLRVPTPGNDSDVLPTGIAIAFSKPGFTSQVLEQVPMPNDATALIIDMQPGRGIRHVDQTHARVREEQAADATAPLRAAPESAPNADAELALSPDRPERAAVARQLAAASATVPVPSSIRVGMNCSGRSCSSVSVYAMEDYVGRGLDDEWISSWSTQSLAAGAVAYRSYAAWFAAHPVSRQYDICSSTSCQVFRSAAVSSTVNAARLTRGVVLTRDGKTSAFSEYSSENNAWNDPNDGLSCSNTDLSCGNGNNGSPRNGWPCLSDSVGRGRGCFGHGRGMSQWGTQRWASQHQRDWKWITNHYFNGNDRPGGMRNAYLANLGSDPPPTGRVLDTFESGVGHFNRAPTWSGSTVGIAASSLAERDCGMRKAGSCSLHVLLRDNASTAADWAVRLVSGSGEPAGNAKLTRVGGKLGFWIYAGGSGMQVGVSVDDGSGTERSQLRSVPVGQWTYVSWAFDDANQWNAWAGSSNGRIDAASVTVDAIWLHRAQTRYDVHLYVDEVQVAY